MTGHPCTAGLFDDKGEAHVFQEMYTCSSIKMIDGIDKTVPGYSSPVHGKQCKKWRHVSHMQPGVGFIFTSPSPFGLYKATSRRNNGHSDPTMTPALYFYDKLGWEPHSSYTYSWNTKVSFFSFFTVFDQNSLNNSFFGFWLLAFCKSRTSKLFSKHTPHQRLLYMWLCFLIQDFFFPSSPPPLFLFMQGKN